MELELFEKSWMDVWNGMEPQEPVGAVFTKPEIIGLVLDLAGYIPGGGRLADRPLLEPSCGDGAFLAEAARRLIASERAKGAAINWMDPALDGAITACDVNLAFVSQARGQIAELLAAEGCPAERSGSLALHWVRHMDFLLADFDRKFEFVVGNPPYVRIEDLPAPVLRRYRELYPTSADRADLYVAFIERGLRLLSASGCLSYICANRFAKNHYGRGLRHLIAREYHVRFYLNLEHTQPFVTEVSAYPCILVIDQGRGTPTRAATLTALDSATLESVNPARLSSATKSLNEFPEWYADGAPWVATERKSFDLLASLGDRLPLLEGSAADTRVGIGVATGADRVFITRGLVESVELECQMPLLMAADIRPDLLSWSGHYLINPYETADMGGLRDLARYPGLSCYYLKHREALERRHVAQKRATGWYRTIDRVSASLLPLPKLVIPDIQAGGVVGLDQGRFYPHHNVYWITSVGWDLRVLQALLRSRWILDQVKAHSVQMRGGSLRYQAQVLRRLRLPHFGSMPEDVRAELVRVCGSLDLDAVDAAAEAAFRLD